MGANELQVTIDAKFFFNWRTLGSEPRTAEANQSIEILEALLPALRAARTQAPNIEPLEAISREVFPRPDIDQRSERSHSPELFLKHHAESTLIEEITAATNIVEAAVTAFNGLASWQRRFVPLVDGTVIEQLEEFETLARKTRENFDPLNPDAKAPPETGSDLERQLKLLPAQPNIDEVKTAIAEAVRQVQALYALGDSQSASNALAADLCIDATQILGHLNEANAAITSQDAIPAELVSLVTQQGVRLEELADPFEILTDDNRRKSMGHLECMRSDIDNGPLFRVDSGRDLTRFLSAIDWSIDGQTVPAGASYFRDLARGYSENLISSDIPSSGWHIVHADGEPRIDGNTVYASTLLEAEPLLTGAAASQQVERQPVEARGPQAAVGEATPTSMPTRAPTGQPAATPPQSEAPEQTLFQKLLKRRPKL